MYSGTLVSLTFSCSVSVVNVQLVMDKKLVSFSEHFDAGHSDRRLPANLVDHVKGRSSAVAAAEL
jgi:hypothetical protein